MKGSRTFRVIFGIFVLMLFGAYSFMRYTTSPHSSDFDSENAFIYSEALARIEPRLSFRPSSRLRPPPRPQGPPPFPPRSLQPPPSLWVRPPLPRTSNLI